jgi:hypothetical protein
LKIKTENPAPLVIDSFKNITVPTPIVRGKVTAGDFRMKLMRIGCIRISKISTDES